jgi:hypothetical protein
MKVVLKITAKVNASGIYKMTLQYASSDSDTTNNSATATTTPYYLLLLQHQLFNNLYWNGIKCYIK